MSKPKPKKPSAPKPGELVGVVPETVYVPHGSGICAAPGRTVIYYDPADPPPEVSGVAKE